MVLIGLAVAIALPVLAVVVLLSAALAQCGNGIPTANVVAPAGDPATEAQFVEYFESQGIPANAAAGITGNLYQESGLDPTEPGYGLAQWNPSWSALPGWISAHGQDPDTAAGQLMYIAANLNQGVDGQEFYSGLRSDMYGASSPQEAAIRWMNDYEQCQGAGPPGTLEFDPAGLCMGEQRERYAVQELQAAGGGSSVGPEVLVSTQLGGVCNGAYPLTGSIRGYTNPFAKTTGLVWERTDQGVDARMNPGSPLLAFAPSKVEMIVARLLRRRAGDCLRDHGRAAGQQVVVLVSAGWGPPRSVKARRSQPDKKSRRTRRRALGSRSAGGRPTAATRSGTRVTRKGSPLGRGTSATSYGRWVPTLVLVPACPAAKRWATRTTRPGPRGRDPPRDRAARCR